MAERKTTRDVGPLSVRGTVAPESLNEEDRTVDLIWTTGERVLRGFFDQFWEELSLDPDHVHLDRLNNGAPLLDAHNGEGLSGVLGVVEKARLEGKKRGVAKVRFAKAEDDPHADAIFRKVKDGIIRNVSVGYRVHKMEKVGEAEGEVPVYRVVDWTPYEISMVPMGADAGAGIRAEGAETNPCVFVTKEERKMAKDSDETTATTVTAQAQAIESPAVAATRAASERRIAEETKLAEAKATAREEARAQERLRISEINKLARISKLGDAWAATLIDAGTSIQEARDAAFAGICDPASARTLGIDIGADGRITVGEDERDKQLRGASAWLFQRTGTRALIEKGMEKYPEHFKDVAFDPGEFRGLSPVELARHFLERGGVNTRGMDRMKMVGLAFTHRSIVNYQTAGEFAVLLENVLGKVLLGAYATQSNTWELFAKRDEVPDFRTSNRYRTGSLPGLDVIAEHAEYKNGVIPDGAKYPLSTQRMGKMFGISQETIINDDMGALTQMASELGKAAQRSIENAVYALLALNSGLGPTQSDSQPFFHANRANVATGTALSATGALDADRITMRAQKDPNGQDYLDLNPAVLLVPESLRGLALQINGSEWDVTVSNKFQIPNPVRSMLRSIVSSPRLTGTRRYMFADTMDAIVVAFLEGQPGPVIDTQNGWRIDGTEFKVTLYAKAQMGDPKAAVTNAGV